ncbi:methylmalonyl-CoA mutase family protein [Nocardioides marmorisolisilvae]|uniref:Methylmalonyl-CoA mutase n=1 Tax=Nocardioides marmorisolisilvae TaxID=1542737 RepID=A0A3N0DSF7_9ACTN|nr:methylmalonyl-CoA mutase family protein [Nocardioides marmorisolisilvae]RNL78564.1 methylmalonyl-CoA mutase [Nocardioides marmorisolisilvae]
MTHTPQDAPQDAPTVALATGREHTREDWEKLAAGVLRKSGRIAEGDADALVWDKLTRRTLDGIAITPLGTPALVGNLTTAGRPDRAGEWDVRGYFADPDATLTANDVQTDLDNGVTSVWLEVGAGGVATDDLAAALKGVLLDVAPVILDSDDPVAAASAFAAVASGTTLADGTNLGADPLGARLRGADVDVDSVVAQVAATAGELGCRALVVDGTAVHDLGASDVQELGWSLAVGAAYLRALVAAGHSVEAAAALIEFRYAATDEQFPTIAKLRAARRGWDRVLELSGVEGDRRQRQHAVTSRPMMTKYDPWVNMLRTCVAAFSAGVGGADALTVLPFDAHLGLPDAFSRRIARNTSALLIHESHLAKVSDPAGGAYAIEKLTDDLAVAGWAELGTLEAAGGAAAAIADGSLQARIDEVVTERELQIALRKRPLTGLSEFPNLDETLPERRPYAAGARAVRSWGHDFEALRDNPAGTVFLATMGTVAAHTARATFASNLLAAGGIATVNPGRNDDVAAVVAAYQGPDGRQPVVCLTGADKAYAEWGADLVAALREAGARWIILAGKPVDGVETDDSCAMGVNTLDFLNRTREKLA